MRIQQCDEQYAEPLLIGLQAGYNLAKTSGTLGTPLPKPTGPSHQDDSSLRADVEIGFELFGDGILPYLPTALVSGLFV